MSRWKPSEHNFENFTTRGRFSEKNRKNWSQNVQVLRLQVVGNSAMITDRRKLTSKWSQYELSSFHFYTSHGLYAAHQKGTYPNFRRRPMSDIAYCATRDFCSIWAFGASVAFETVPHRRLRATPPGSRVIDPCRCRITVQRAGELANWQVIAHASAYGPCGLSQIGPFCTVFPSFTH